MIGKKERVKLLFLSTLSLRRATQRQIEFERYSDISIHALLAESDRSARPETRPSYAISIHALLAESDHGGPIMQFNICAFLLVALLAESD